MSRKGTSPPDGIERPRSTPGAPTAGGDRGRPEMVDHPAHYNKHPSGVECIEIVRHMNFNRGNAIKYLWRAGNKGELLEDLKKAMFYLRDEINQVEKQYQEISKKIADSKG